jgi:hypothetical protein
VRRFELPKSESNLKAHMMGRISLRMYRVAALTDKETGNARNAEIETLKKLTGSYMHDSTFFYKVPDWYILLFRPSSPDLSSEEI